MKLVLESTQVGTPAQELCGQAHGNVRRGREGRGQRARRDLVRRKAEQEAQEALCLHAQLFGQGQLRASRRKLAACLLDLGAGCDTIAVLRFHQRQRGFLCRDGAVDDGDLLVQGAQLDPGRGHVGDECRHDGAGIVLGGEEQGAGGLAGTQLQAAIADGAAAAAEELRWRGARA